MAEKRKIEFENTSPGWSSPGAEPSPEFKQEGFKAGYKPPAGYFNWFWSRVSACIAELQAKVKGYAGANEEDKAQLEAQLAAKLEEEEFTGANMRDKLNATTGLNADLLDGKHGASFADKVHGHAVASANAAGFMGAGDKVGLTNHLASRANPHGVTTGQIGAAEAAVVDSHLANKNNPHGVTKAQVGLGNVDNVKPMPYSSWNWVGQAGQPSYLWGGNALNQYYVWNPANFSVNYAASAGNAAKLAGRTAVASSVVGRPNEWGILLLFYGGITDIVSISRGDSLVADHRVQVSAFSDQYGSWFVVLARHDGTPASGVFRINYLRLHQ